MFSLHYPPIISNFLLITFIYKPNNSIYAQIYELNYFINKIQFGLINQIPGLNDYLEYNYLKHE